jgi:hypothetical protein
VIKVFAKRVLILFVLFGSMLRQALLALGFDELFRVIERAHGERREKLLEIAALTRRARRDSSGTNEGFEFMAASSAGVIV